MNVIEIDLRGVKLIKPRVFEDDRGFFLETFHRSRYEEALGTNLDFVQDNHSFSTKGVLRGLHFQMRHPQAKLVRVVHGSVFDVVADVDPTSPTFGKWRGFTLDEENKHQLYVPKGYAHGFQVLSESADLEYKCIGYYAANDESGVVWNDPDLAIRWPLRNPILSTKDLALPTLSDVGKTI